MCRRYILIGRNIHQASTALMDLFSRKDWIMLEKMNMKFVTVTLESQMIDGRQSHATLYRVQQGSFRDIAGRHHPCDAKTSALT